MSISIQGSTAAQLATMESLTTKQGDATGAGATSLLDALNSQNGASPNASSIIDIAGGSPPVSGVSAGLATSASIADSAVAAGTTIEGLLAQMRQDAVTASNPDLDSDSRAALDSGFKANLAQIQKAVSSAGVEGTNLIDGSVNGAANVSAATLTGVNLSLGGPLIGLSADASLAKPADAAALASQIGAAIDKVGKAVDQIASQGQAIESHLSVISQAGLSLSPAVGGAVNGNLDGDGARLAALQVQQQLSLAGGSLAGGSPNAILSLFQTN